MTDVRTSGAGGAPSSAGSSDLILYEAEGRIATITVNRPAVRNAIDYETAQALADALDRFDGDDAVSVGILTGAGGVFCAGMDLKAVAAGGRRPITESRGALGICAKPPEKPIIAAVEKFALGGGLELALACDLIVVGSDAKLGLPEVKRGQIPAGGGVIRLPRRISGALAMEMILTGEPLTPAQALTAELINRVTNPGDTLRVAHELATAIGANAPLSVRTAKRLVYESATWPIDDAFALQQPSVQVIRESADATEGARAFADKRDPVWTGR